MRRIAVVATIRDAYIFTLTQLGSVIGLIWVAMVMLTVARFFVFHRFYDAFIEFMAGGNPAQMGPVLLMMLAYLAAALLLYAVMLVGVVQLVMGTRSAPSFIHFSFGALEWRMFRAFFAFVGLMMLASMSILLAVDAIVAVVPGAKLDQAAIGNVMALAMIAVGMVMAARFLLLLPAIAVHETGPALRRAWALSAGNFWPLVGVLIGLFLPLLLVFVLIDAGMGERGLAIASGPPQLRAIAAIKHMQGTLPITCGLSFFFSPLVVGLFASASFSIWRTLKDEPVLDIAV
jgi:hypothetical protein